MLHEPTNVIETDNEAPKKAKLGVILLIAYTLIYSGIVLIGLTKPGLVGLEVMGGQNIAIT